MVEPAVPSGDEGPHRRQHGLSRRVLRTNLSQEYMLYRPTAPGPEPGLLVSVHGASRNMDEHGKLLAAYCEMYGVTLVVPHFSTAHHPDYQRLGRAGRGARADLALHQIVEEVSRETDVPSERFHLFGFSGGAQFAHRYAMAHPHRVAGVVIASAGWYTFPDPARRYPHGIRPGSSLPDVRFDPEEFLTVPMTVIAGGRESDAKGLRRSERLDREQGTTRSERARTWVAAMEAAARAHHLDPAVAYEELDGCSHRFRRSMLRGGLAEKVFEVTLDPARVCGA